jgi:glycosyltransferase involved in cell wall biosynthesis
MQQISSKKLVSIGVPIYKRLEFLPGVLKMVEAQDYPYVELVVSDNGQNGTKVRDLIEAQYSRPYRFRQNQSTVSISPHYNQIIEAASGEYFVNLDDDDEISPNFVSELVGQLERHPEATVAFSKQETINASGEVIRKSNEDLPNVLSGPEFIRATWERHEFGFGIVETFLFNRKLLLEAGGYPDFPRGNHSDDAAAIRACLNHHVVFSAKCTFRHRVHEGGGGWQASIKELAVACRQFMRFLDDDPTIRVFAAAHPAEWRDLKRVLVSMSSSTYFWRWRDIYRNRLSAGEWVKAAFAMPFIPSYYRNVLSVFRDTGAARLKGFFTGQSEKQPNFFQPGYKDCEDNQCQRKQETL